ncbi:MAG: hypothetical protein JNL19_12310 [Burkholderiales bacterium]|nr:hypothetical protein [Burkholderiales bacterium]
MAQIKSSQFVSQSVSASMAAGQSYPVSLTFSNNGTSTWSASTGYKLGAQNPQDNMTWGTNRVVLPSDVAPGQQVTISFSVTAPAVAGTYNFQWQLIQEGVQWFGATSTNTSVVVTTAGTNSSGSNLISNGGFETPVTGNYLYNPSIPGWSASGGVAVQRNGSDWGATTAPEGVQTAVLQNLGMLSTSVTLSSAQHTLKFKAAARTSWGGLQTVVVKANGSQLLSITPLGAAFGQYQATFTAINGANNISFEGTNDSGDNTAFIDDVQLTSNAPAGSNDLATLQFSGESHYDYALHFSKFAGLVGNSYYAGNPNGTAFASKPAADGIHSEIFWIRSTPPSTGNSQGIDPIQNWTNAGISYNGEEFGKAFNCAGGLPFLWQYAFNQYDVDPITKAVTSYRYPFKADKVLLEFSGKSVDITAGGACGASGIPYALANVPTVPYTLKVWATYQFGGKFYWQVRFDPPTAITNSCWSGAGNNTSPAIKQSEAWWDGTQQSNGVWNGNWVLGSGTNGPDGLPTGANVAYGSTGTLAKNRGWLWTGSTAAHPDWVPCLRSTWSW